MLDRYGMVRLVLTALSAVAVLAGCTPSREVSFKMHVINADSRFEAACVFDVNKDSVLDIYSGGFWYEGPGWTKHFVRSVEMQNDYYFDLLVFDPEGSGKMDLDDASARENCMEGLLKNL